MKTELDYLNETMKRFPALETGDINENLIVVGDPDRVFTIAEYLDDAVLVGKSREYRVLNGTYKGKAITIASHGVGSAGAATAFEKLIQIGAKKMIRVGTAGTYYESNPPGTILIADSAVREEGISYQLVPKGMPAVADFYVTQALLDSVKKTEFKYDVGTIVTLDVFFDGVFEFPHKEYKAAGAKGAEMEMATLFVVAKLRGIAAGGVVALDSYADASNVGYNPDADYVHKAVEQAIIVALDAAIAE